MGTIIWFTSQIQKRHFNRLIISRYDVGEKVKVVYFRSKKAGIRLLEYPLSLILLTYAYLLKVIVFGLVDMSKVIVYVPSSGTVKFLPLL